MLNDAEMRGARNHAEDSAEYLLSALALLLAQSDPHSFALMLADCRIAVREISTYLDDVQARAERAHAAIDNGD